jgi:hypothetical protein
VKRIELIETNDSLYERLLTSEIDQQVDIKENSEGIRGSIVHSSEYINKFLISVFPKILNNHLLNSDEKEFLLMVISKKLNLGFEIRNVIIKLINDIKLSSTDLKTFLKIFENGYN